MSRTLAIVFLAAFVTSVAIAQTNRTASVNGFIYDASNGEALIGANVFIENTLLGSSTNLNGYYVIPKIPAGESILIVDYIGYKQFFSITNSIILCKEPMWKPCFPSCQQSE